MEMDLWTGASTKTKEALSVFNNPNISVKNLSVNFQVKMGWEHKNRDL